MISADLVIEIGVTDSTKVLMVGFTLVTTETEAVATGVKGETVSIGEDTVSIEMVVDAA